VKPVETEKQSGSAEVDAGPDSAKSPIKQPKSPSDTQPETPKVGSTDALGG
jgi:hypothetical protein